MAEFLDNLFSDKNTFALKKVPDRFKSDIDERYQNHLFISSSGTSSKLHKVYAISYEALKISAMSVNSFIESIDQPNWLSPLSFYHIGGLSTYIRSSLLGGKVFNLSKWDLNNFLKMLNDHSIHYTSIVPTIAFDIAQKKVSPNQSLKGIFIGGDYLDDFIKNQLIDLGWPIYITYGMTECSSQIATSFAIKEPHQFMKILPHHQINSKNDILWIKSKSLFTSIIYLDDQNNIIKEEKPLLEGGFWKTQDRINIKDGLIQPLGRIDDYVKVKGQLFSLHSLHQQISSKLKLIRGIDYHLDLQNDLRDSYKLYVFVNMENREKISDFIKEQSSLKYFKVLSMDNLERTELGKIKKYSRL